METNQVKFLSGRYQAVTVAKGYTAQTTLTNFMDNSAIGDIAIVKKSDNTIYDGTSAIPANTEIYLIKKLRGSYKSYPSFVFKPSGYAERYAVISSVIGSVGVLPIKRVTVSFGGNSDCGNSINGYADPLVTYVLAIMYYTYEGIPDTIEYSYVPKSGDTIENVVNALIAKMNNAVSFENAGRTLRATAGSTTVTAVSGQTPGTIVFDITGKTFQNITIGISGFCKQSVADLVIGKRPINGYDDVAQYEAEGLVIDGRLTKQDVLPPLDDVSKPDYVTSGYASNSLFTAYQLERFNKEKAQVAGEDMKSKTYFETIYALNSSAVATKLTTLFGL